MIEEELSKLLLKHFEEHQLDEDSLSYSSAARVAAIRKKLSVMTLNSEISGLSLKQRNSSKCHDLDDKIQSILLHYVDKIMDADVTNGAQDPIERVMDLVSALVVTCSEEVAEAIVARTIQFSTVLLERVRNQASIFMGYLALHFSEREEEWALEWFEALKDAIIPRLTDKSQSVRNSAIRAAGNFFLSQNDKIESEDLLEMLLWNLWHDPSVANRAAALEAIPVTQQTVDHIVTRIRDVKEKVRIQAIEILRNKVDPCVHMTPHHFSEILRCGLSARCKSTKEATSKLICVNWMKAAKFDPVKLLKLMGVIINEEECEKGMKVILDVARSGDWAIIDELSEPEIRAFQSSITPKKSISEIIASGTSGNIEELFFARIACTTAQESSALSTDEKYDMLNKIPPDVPLWCECFANYSIRLAEAAGKGESNEEDEYSFICLQLLQMVDVIGLKEEGSRRHFSSFMKDILSSENTPDDLIEGCIESLRGAHENEGDFFRAIDQIIQDLSSEKTIPSECTSHETLRILSILTIVLENASSAISSDSLFQEASKFITSSVTSSDGLVREVGVSCLGKLGLYADKTHLVADLKPILLQVTLDEKEKIEIRSQALLALSDWSMLFSEMLHPCQLKDETVSFLGIVESLVQHTNPSVAAIAAEVSIKLLFSGRVCESNLVGHLLFLFFEPNQQRDDKGNEIENKEVGSMVRLQQLLSLFFAAYCLKSEYGRNAVLGSLEFALGLGFNQKRSKRKAAFPFLKMIEFVCSIVENGAEAALSTQDGAQSSTEEKIYSDVEVEKTASVALSVSIQVAKFLISADLLPVTQTRVLCKFLSNQDIVIEDKHTLFRLKDLMEEVSMVISDGPSLRSLSQLNDKLANIDFKDFETSFHEEGSCDDTVTEGEDDVADADNETDEESTVDDSVMNSMAMLNVQNKENVRESSSSKTSRGRVQGNRRGRSERRSDASILDSL